MKLASIGVGIARHTVAFAATAVLTLAGASVPATSAETTVEELVAAGQAEGGTLNAYLASEYDFLVSGFLAEYPWAKVNYTQLSAGASASRLFLELSSGSYQADVAGSQTSRAQQFIAGNYLAKIEVPNDAGYLPGIQDPGSFTHPMNLSIRVIGYNSALVPAGPTTLAELADPKWKGALVMDDPSLGAAGTDLLATQRVVMGDEAWEAWLQAFKANEPLIVRDGGEAYAMVLSGERSLCICQIQDILNQAEGTPVAYTPYNQDSYGLISSPIVALTPAQAPHPAMAALFLNWMESPAGGQLAFCQASRTPAVPVPDCKVGIPDDVKVTSISTFEDYFNNPTAYTDKFKALFNAAN